MGIRPHRSPIERSDRAQRPESRGSPVCVPGLASGNHDARIADAISAGFLRPPACREQHSVTAACHRGDGRWW